MAIYRLEMKTISRADGRTATAAAAYRSGSSIEDERTGEVFDYTRKQGVSHSEILLPENAPEHFADRSTLWNEAEQAERRKNSRVARELIVALPHELEEEDRTNAARTLAQHMVNTFGVAVDLAIHGPDRQADQRNHHAHLLFSTRELGEDGFGAKTRELDDRQTGPERVQDIRERWQDFARASLREAGHHNEAEKLDHRSLEKQGIDRIPEPKQGAIATEMERVGRESHAGNDRRAVQAANDNIAQMEREAEVIDLEIEREKRRIVQEQEADQLGLAQELAGLYAQQQRDVEAQIADQQAQLDNQNFLQRFWYGLSGHNARVRDELDALEEERQRIEQERQAADLEAQQLLDLQTMQEQAAEDREAEIIALQAYEDEQREREGEQLETGRDEQGAEDTQTHQSAAEILAAHSESMNPRTMDYDEAMAQIEQANEAEQTNEQVNDTSRDID